MASGGDELPPKMQTMVTTMPRDKKDKSGKVTKSTFSKYYTGNTILTSSQNRGYSWDYAQHFVLEARRSGIDPQQWGRDWSTAANKYGLNAYAREKVRELGDAWTGPEIYDERLDSKRGTGVFYPFIFDLFTTLCTDNSAYPTNFWIWQCMAIWNNYSTELLADDKTNPTTISVTEMAAAFLSSPWFEQKAEEKKWISTVAKVKVEDPSDDPTFEVTCRTMMQVARLTAGISQGIPPLKQIKDAVVRGIIDLDQLYGMSCCYDRAFRQGSVFPAEAALGDMTRYRAKVANINNLA